MAMGRGAEEEELKMWRDVCMCSEKEVIGMLHVAQNSSTFSESFSFGVEREEEEDLVEVVGVEETI